MLCILTSIHDPVALAQACERYRIPHPQESATGWVVRLTGLHAAIVVNTLTGVVTYDRRDNGFGRYARLMRFIYRVHDLQAQRRRQARAA